jgi:hypothetical protein
MESNIWKISGSYRLKWDYTIDIFQKVFVVIYKIVHFAQHSYFFTFFCNLFENFQYSDKVGSRVQTPIIKWAADHFRNTLYVNTN